MIDGQVLDQVLPIPESETLKESIIQELDQDGFAITNFGSGGIFNTLLMIVIQIRIELVKLLRSVLNNMFISHAEGEWLELKAGDFAKTRKDATRTQGVVMVSRMEAGEAVKITRGHIFKTVRDINGDELRFFVVEDTVLQKDALNIKVTVEAEDDGSRYNVPAGQITKSLVHIDGIDEIKNPMNWITQEGSDTEDLESLRSRVLKSWSELSTRPIRDKIQNVCEAVPGVLFARVDDQHPRGQGTVDVIITGTAGEATEGLITAVSAAVDAIRGTYDNILVKSSEMITQPVEVAVTIPSSLDFMEGLEDKIKAVITNLFEIKKGRNLNELIHADIIFALKSQIPAIQNVKVTMPPEDVTLLKDKVIVLGEISPTLQRV